jgi:hypothetical protein
MVTIIREIKVLIHEVVAYLLTCNFGTLSIIYRYALSRVQLGL